MFTSFGPLGTWEGKPENGNAASLVGNPDLIWTDGDNSTYATIQYGGFENPWGHPYAQMLELPLVPELANMVEDVIVTWTARLLAPDPSAPVEYNSTTAVSPFLRMGRGEPGNAGPNWHSLGNAAWWGDNSQSLYYPVNQETTWEETYLPADGSWKTFRERLIPIYTDRTVQELLAHDFSGTRYRTPAEMAASGTVDAENTYAIIYQDSFWSADKFAVSEVTFEFVGINPDTVIEAGGINARARFT